MTEMTEAFFFVFLFLFLCSIFC